MNNKTSKALALRCEAMVRQWKECAKKLASALETTPWSECGELNHRGGHYHAAGEECPVCNSNRAALKTFYQLSSNNRDVPTPVSNQKSQ